jgi:hypothetical protein
MKNQHVYNPHWRVATLFLLLTATACGNIPATVIEPTPSQPPEVSSSPTPASVETTATKVPVADADVLYQDDFTNPGTAWPEDKFDNYFIGYHEPEYYHVEINGTNYKTTVFQPEKQSFEDFTVELQVLTNSTKTAPTGDFRYGLAFRRSGDQYYALTISPRAKKWFFLKSSPSGLVVLNEGTDEEIHELDTNDLLRVDAQGSNFSFHINEQFIGQFSDTEYASGEVGFYVESFDSPNTHIHFDTLVIRNLEISQPQDPNVTLLYQDDFTNPASAWPERKFDNYFIGYHEPEYYHIEITGPNYKTSVFEPQKRSFDDFTVELQVFTAASKTAAEGDFRYGLAFRRSGDQYYAFTVSPRSKKWYFLKSSPNALDILAEGSDDNIHDVDVDDTLRVDSQGPSFLFHINDRLVGQVTDSDYASGEVGFYVESFDSPNTHIHFDTLTIRNFEISMLCDVTALTLNVRTGPGKSFATSGVVSNGATVEPVGISSDGEWIKIKVDGSEDGGWVSNSSSFLACNADVDLLPVVNP